MNDIFAVLYELITGQETELSKLAYDNGTYFPLGISMLLISATGMAVYYYAINHPGFSRWFHWLIAVIILCLINFGIAYAMADGVVWDTFGNTEGYMTEIISLGIANVIWTFVFSFIFSMCMKRGSINCKLTPF